MSSSRKIVWIVAALGAATGVYFLARQKPPTGAGSSDPVSSGAAASPPPPVARPLLVSSTKGDPSLIRVHTFSPESGLKALGAGTTKEFDAAWSPDGSRCAFASFTASVDAAPAAQIVTMAPDGSDRKTISPSEPGVVAISPKWSPDGRYIAYSTVRFQQGQPPDLALYLVEPDGQGARKIGEGVLPDFSPDGKSIAYTAFDNAQTFAPSLRSLDVAQGTSKELTKGENAMMPAYSPDGKSIAFVSDGGIGPLPDVYIMSPDGTGKRRMTATDGDFETAPRWSPDGKTLYFARLSNDEVPHASLQSVPAEGGSPTRLTEETFTTIPGNGAGFLMVMLTGQGRTLFETKQP